MTFYCWLFFSSPCPTWLLGPNSVPSFSRVFFPCVLQTLQKLPPKGFCGGFAWTRLKEPGSESEDDGVLWMFMDIFGLFFFYGFFFFLPALSPTMARSPEGLCWQMQLRQPRDVNINSSGSLERHQEWPREFFGSARCPRWHLPGALSSAWAQPPRGWGTLKGSCCAWAHPGLLISKKKSQNQMVLG